MKINAGDKIYILGNGNQAPYGIGEIIDIIPAAHIRKVRSVLERYYNHPVLRLNGKTGERLSIEGNEYHIMNPY